MLLIEVANAHGCSKCAKSEETAENLVRDVNGVYVKEVNIAEDPDFAIKHGIMYTPSLVINGCLELPPFQNQMN